MGGRSKLPVLLTEMVLMLLIFSLASAVCLGIFAAARASSARSAELGRAAQWAQSAAEAYRAARGDAEAARETLDAAELDGGNGFALYFGRDWQISGAQECAYCLTLTETGESAARVRVSSGGAGSEDTLFAMDIRVAAYG